MTDHDHDQAREEEREDMVQLARTETERTLTEYGVAPAEIALILGSGE
ncbi:hypothetical protein [Streptomyces sp. AP-93]|nr:hypothetical protein [Streptomyces sp. AP-93]MCJ0868064.1 hypothetical protein [Streptomyces sp. AP-93]